MEKKISAKAMEIILKMQQNELDEQREENQCQTVIGRELIQPVQQVAKGNFDNTHFGSSNREWFQGTGS